MKKTMIFAAFAALLSLASCQKNEPTDVGPDINIGAENNASPVFTAIINPGTKTTVDVTDGKVSWEASDEITVKDAANNSAVYVIESIDATTGKATFVIKEGGNDLGDGPYSAVYGTPPAKEQIYSATAGRLYMTAPATSDNSFTFTVQCGLMKLNLTKYGVSVKSIAVTGTPTSGETTYTLTCNPAESISSAKDFFIALPDGSYNKIEITNVSDSKCTLNSASGISVAANHIKPVTFDGSKLSFAALPPYALPGRFSVADDKQVHFARGNLYANKIDFSGVSYWMWKFYSHQYDCNSLNTGESRTATEEDTEIDLFTWGYDASTSLKPIGTNYPVNFTDWGNNIAGAVWRTPTIEEWQYLFTGRSNASNLYKCGVTVCEKQNCVVIAPDNWNLTASPLQSEYSATSTPMTWSEAQAAGLVCLPAAGCRINSSIVRLVDDRGYYWSSSANGSDYAYNVSFVSSFVSSGDSNDRCSGFSVRLITESN